MNSYGTIFDLKRFSIHDGPGIRTTVFFKGCPLSCLWCHNPEGISFNEDIWIKEETCISCGNCVKNCKQNALSLSEGKVKIDRDICNFCNACINACPTLAIQRIDKKISTDKLVNILLRDKIFAKTSSGGVTISGGEPLAQPEFLLELLKKLKDNGVHTCVETSMMAPQSVLEQIIPYTDLILADIKLFDDNDHQKYVGCTNKHILNNIKYAAKSCKSLNIRVPLIPNITDNKDNLVGVAKFVKQFAPNAVVELLEYNSLAPNKYRFLDKAYFAPELSSQKEDEIHRLAALVESIRKE